MIFKISTLLLIDSELDKTLTASECGSQDETPMDISELENVDIEVQPGPQSKKEQDNRLNQQLKEKLEVLNRVGQESELFNEHVKLEQVVDVSIILLLLKVPE